MNSGNLYIPELDLTAKRNDRTAGSGKPNKKRGKAGKIVLSVFVILLFLILGFAFLFYRYLMTQIPDVSNLRRNAAQFETLRIFDKRGGLLYEIVPPDAGRRDYVTIDHISPYVLAAVIAVEDADYYNHPGYDISAILRAFLQNAESGETVSGASTITQQLARNLLLSQQERSERSYQRKIKEVILAAEITRRYSKDEILEIYLNENYYGVHAYGIEAASQTYFHTTSDNLSFAQAAFLAGLPQAPGYYDVFTNRDATLDRFKTALLLTYDLSQKKGCIAVRNGSECVRIDPLMVNNAVRTMEEYTFPAGDFEMKYPQWVNYVYSILEKQYGADTLYRSGFSVYTTLDPEIQDMAQAQLRSQIDSLRGANVHNGAVVVMDPKTGDILAMVGSPDFSDSDHGGQINMAVSPRQPGSAIKPLVYAAAFEKGWTPATVIWDVETDFSPTGKPEDLRYAPPYRPANYDRTFHGPVLAREALASSLNIPAVKALEYVGIYGNDASDGGAGFISFAKRLHINSLDKPGYGLSIALGGGEVTLLELTNAYSAFANNGRYVSSRAVLKIENYNGDVIYNAPEPFYDDVIRPEYAYQISSILSDDSARALGFGWNSILNLSFPAAVKTGTTNDYRDNWAIGYNSGLLVGVWVGNADNQPMQQMTGVTGAAPVWRSVMEGTASYLPQIRNAVFSRPAELRDAYICTLTGTIPDHNCAQVKLEVFAADRPPLEAKDGFIKHVMVDTWTGKIASAECSQHAESRTVLDVNDSAAINWIKNTYQGQVWAETNNLTDMELMTATDVLYPPCGYPALDMVSPADNVVIEDEMIDIVLAGFIDQPEAKISVEFTEASAPENWKVIQNDIVIPAYTPTRAAEWFIGDLAPGDYLLKARVSAEHDKYYEVVHHIFVNNASGFSYEDGYYYNDDTDDQFFELPGPVDPFEEYYIHEDQP